ncbi:O-antigen/teichoic acid export membrane protein [Skermanella aerolata]|uniref:lipopolysaccharide biosynthesis protein n=1 Tax=Skermanella aerolata TaxID=393310 RepID=UPI003D26112A
MTARTRTLSAVRLLQAIGATAGRWRGRVVHSVAEQALVSLTGLGSQLVMIRWMRPELFGIVAIVQIIQTTLLTVVHNVIIEPAAVVGARDHADETDSYIARLVLVSTAAAALGGCLLALAAFLPPIPADMTSPLVGAAACLPALAWYNAARAAAYLKGLPLIAMRGAAVLAVASAVLLGGLYWLDAFSTLNAVLAMGLANAAGALAVMIALRVPARIVLAELRQARLLGLVREHWRFGSWLLANGMSLQVTRSLYPLILAPAAGLEATAVFRAMMTLSLPLQKINEALSNLSQPLIAHRIHAWGRPEHVRYLVTTLTITAGAGLAAIVIAGLSSGWIMTLLFKEEIYREFSWLLPVVFIYTVIFACVDLGVFNILRARGRYKPVFIANIAGAVTTLLVGLELTWLLGLAGASAGLALSGVVSAAVAVVLVRRELFQR